MTALPLPPTHLLTIGEYAALGETEVRTELEEGNLVMSPSPMPRHMIAIARMLVQLAPQLPPHLEVIPEVDIDLALVPPDQPGSSRRPDLIVARGSAVTRVEAEGGILRASDVLVVVEVLSPGSRRTDRMVKRAEYADAGIPHYWIVDIEPPVSLLACQLAEGAGYRDWDEVTGTFTASEPFPVRLDLDRLR